MPDEPAALAAFGYELGLLKRIRRAGWWHVGVRDPESVAEHSLRTARKGLATETARRVAEAAVALSPLTWRDR